ncbi:MAG: hypothetical protein EHM48_09960 [Planctomycetaceae bacterium]|nr:MAG: hypothetical protein EHM48_09960 [Planctomycetaceae bacterium]
MTQREIYVSVRIDADVRLSATLGSKDLCAAILATGRTHGPMTEAQQIAAIEYAHDIEYIGGTMVKNKREKK